MDKHYTEEGSYPKNTAIEWVPVTWRHPCPICGEHAPCKELGARCAVSDDGSAVACVNVPEGSIGWTHEGVSIHHIAIPKPPQQRKKPSLWRDFSRMTA